MNRRAKQPGGFTLVELTTAAAMIALLTSAAFITYAQTWRHWVLRQNAQQFYHAAKYARMLAIESRKPCRLVIDKSKGLFSIVQDGNETGQTAVVSNIYHRSVNIDDSITFEKVTAISIKSDKSAEGVITFYADGSADAAMVQMGNGIRSYTVRISGATARAVLLDGSGDNYEADQIDLDGVL